MVSFLPVGYACRISSCISIVRPFGTGPPDQAALVRQCAPVADTWPKAAIGKVTKDHFPQIKARSADAGPCPLSWAGSCDSRFDKPLDRACEIQAPPPRAFWRRCPSKTAFYAQAARILEHLVRLRDRLRPGSCCQSIPWTRRRCPPLFLRQRHKHPRARHRRPLIRLRRTGLDSLRSPDPHRSWVRHSPPLGGITWLQPCVHRLSFHAGHRGAAVMLIEMFAASTRGATTRTPPSHNRFSQFLDQRSSFLGAPGSSRLYAGLIPAQGASSRQGLSKPVACGVSRGWRGIAHASAPWCHHPQSGAPEAPVLTLFGIAQEACLGQARHCDSRSAARRAPDRSGMQVQRLTG